MPAAEPWQPDAHRSDPPISEDQGRGSPGLSRCPALLLEIPSPEGQGMNHAHDETLDRLRPADTPRRGSRGADPQVRVTLSDDLLDHLRRVAQAKHVPLRWLVAGLVYDTLERAVDRQVALAGR